MIVLYNIYNNFLLVDRGIVVVPVRCVSNNATTTRIQTILRTNYQIFCDEANRLHRHSVTYSTMQLLASFRRTYQYCSKDKDWNPRHKFDRLRHLKIVIYHESSSKCQYHAVLEMASYLVPWVFYELLGPIAANMSYRYR